jgi:glycosyltransferase
MAKLLSIVTVCFNSEATLRPCIQSIIAQKDPRVEYLVIDGASTDGSRAIVEEFQSSIDVVVSEPDRGTYHAMNKGWERASGEYVLFINSDDLLYPGALDEVLATLEDRRADVLMAPVMAIDLQGTDLGLLPVGYVEGKHRYLGMPVCHQGLVIRRDLINSVGGFDESYRIVADFNQLLRLLRSSPEIRLLGTPTAKYRIGGASSGRYYSELRRLHREHGLPPIASTFFITYSRLSLSLQENLPPTFVQLVKKIKGSRYQHFRHSKQ